MAIAIMAVEAGDYLEPDDFDPRMLQVGNGHQASTRDSPYRLQSTADTAIVHTTNPPHMPIITNTIFFSGSGPVATDSVEIIHTIRDTNTKEVFEVCWHGKPAIAKWWATSDVQRFLNQRITYEKIHDRRTGGYPFFASPRAADVICCSSKCPDGFILVITKVKGTPLQDRWPKLSAKNKEFVYVQVRSAIQVLRTVGIA